MKNAFRILFKFPIFRQAYSRHLANIDAAKLAYAKELEASWKKINPDELSELKNNLNLYQVFYSETDPTLADLCDRYGSDKGTLDKAQGRFEWAAHTYTDIYTRLFYKERDSITKVFECGLGTNNPDIPSNMGINGIPGASLRVWRDYFSNAQIFGADVDSDILFSEDRIVTGYLNQLDPASIKLYWNRIGVDDFDIMIDDGLHTFEAGINLFENSIDRMSLDGIYIIEDVYMADLLKYQTYFNNTLFNVEYIVMHRPEIAVENNALILIRKF